MPLPKIETPRYQLTVPSTGQKVSYRPYLVKEEKVLMMAMETSDNQQMANALKDVISACIDSDGFDTNKLAMFDLEYIFAQLRAKSVGETTRVSAKCAVCETKNDLDISLDTVYVSNQSNNDRTISLTDQIGLVMKYPPVDVVLDSQINSTDASTVDQVFGLILSCIESIYSGDEIYEAENQTREELNEFIESLNSKQFARIEHFIENMPQTSLDVSFKCTSCGHQNENTIRGLANFFG